MAMSKGEETKSKILEQAAALFNQQGYFGSSMSDIMRVTGLQKGGIYNHFKSKDELALLSFEYAVSRVAEYYSAALRSKRHAVDRLEAILDLFLQYIDNPPVAGGCPLMNTAIESDDAYPLLRDRCQKAMDSWRDMLCRIMHYGIKHGELKSGLDTDEVATIIISTLEGGVMMSKLYGDSIHIYRSVKHLKCYIARELKI
jgi:TetR/AcrR family transcriptional regulator, transcriptional repressor for nem operon